MSFAMKMGMGLDVIPTTSVEIHLPSFWVLPLYLRTLWIIYGFTRIVLSMLHP